MLGETTPGAEANPSYNDEVEGVCLGFEWLDLKPSEGPVLYRLYSRVTYMNKQALDKWDIIIK